VVTLAGDLLDELTTASVTIFLLTKRGARACRLCFRLTNRCSMVRDTLDEVFAVVSLDGRPMCWVCSTRPPKLDEKWCSPKCKLLGEAMMEHSPVPEEITKATQAIRATWTREEAALRRSGLRRPRRALC
jgi:hypothetical protein